MPRFLRKPIVVEAVQWLKAGDHPKVERVYASDGWCITTLEGTLNVSPGDWIITGVKGEHYPCKPDIFALTYLEQSSPSVIVWVDEYDKLKADSRLLDALRAQGVDNWDGWDDAIEAAAHD